MSVVKVQSDSRLRIICRIYITPKMFVIGSQSAQLVQHVQEWFNEHYYP